MPVYRRPYMIRRKICMSDLLVGILGLAVIAAIVVSLTRGKMLLATGMADVPIKNHIKASAMYVWGFSILCLVFAILIGLVPL